MDVFYRFLACDDEKVESALAPGCWINFSQEGDLILRQTCTVFVTRRLLMVKACITVNAT